MSNRTKTLFKNSLAFTISSFASKLLTFFLIPLYTSVLTTNDYGIADLLTNTTNVIYPILTLSISEATLRFAFDEEDRDSVFSNSIIVIILSELFLSLSLIVISRYSVAFKNHWYWFLLIYLGFNLHQCVTQYAKGIGHTKVFAFSGVIHTFIVIVSNIIGLVYLKKGLNAYLFSIVIGYFGTIAYVVASCRLKFLPRKFDSILLKKMLAFSIPTIPTIIAWWVSQSADKYVIIAYLGVAISGVYSISYKIPSIMTIFTNIFNTAWTISAIQNVNASDNSEFQATVYKYFNICNIFACSILILLAEPLGKILFAKDFFIAWKCVPMLLVAYLFSGLSGFMGSSFRAAKYTKGLFSSTSIGALVNIALNLAVIPRWGIMGAAWTTMIGFAVTFYIRCQTVKKIVDLRINVIKDSIIYFILLIQAILIGNEIKYGEIISAVLLLLIITIYRKDIGIIFNEIRKLALKILKVKR